MNSVHKIANYARSQKHYLTQEYSNYSRFYKNILTKRIEIINEKEIRIVGLRRTGNHAVIGWIRAQHPEYAWHINHPPAGRNPYQFLCSHFKEPELCQEARGDFSKKSLLIISYEDQKLEKVCSEKFERFHDTYVGVSATRFDFLILRDPFNLLASRIKSNMSRITDSSAAEIIQLWKSYAKEFLGETKILTQNKVCINFNRWHSSQMYRKGIADSLGLQFTDAGRERVKGYGGGSSFDGRNHDGEASQLKVLERWKLFEHTDSFWQLFRDEELLSYVERIFDQKTVPLHHVRGNGTK